MKFWRKFNENLMTFWRNLMTFWKKFNEILEKI